MSGPTLTAIYRYPVKSLRGQAFDALDIDARGFVFDRHWMLVDPDGRFLTQRQLSRMALVDTAVDASGVLQLAAPGMPPLAVADTAGDPLPVRVWDDEVEAVAVDSAADDWLSRFLEHPCRLVRMPDTTRRAVDPAYAAPADQVGFADGFPFLLISEGSLDDLNARLDAALPMQRFRPNLVVGGCAAFAEDGWKRIRIGGIEFRVAKPCSRCVIPTIDIDTGERAREPLQTLMTYRRSDNKILFGQNLLHDRGGRLEVGMPVEVIA